MALARGRAAHLTRSLQCQPESCVFARRALQEKPLGEFANLWRKELEEDTGLEQVELGPALADIMAAKDQTEQVTALCHGARQCIRLTHTHTP